MSLTQPAHVTFVSPRQLYNLPIYESHLILDCRPKDQWEADGVHSAHWFPPETSVDDSLRHLIHDLMHGELPEHLNPLIVYNESGVLDARVQSLAERLQTLKETPLNLDLMAFDEELREAVVYFARKLSSTTMSVWFVDGGFAAVKAAYPVICGKASVSELRPLPPCIDDGFYLGSRPVDLDRRLNSLLCIEADLRQGLGIGGLIVNKEIQLPISEADSVQCLRLDVPDQDNVDAEVLISLWNACISFIEQMHENKQSVLVQVWGRSRSTSIAAAWLMRKKGLTVEEALAQLKRSSFYGFQPNTIW